jgi:hypothetical protein
MNVLKIEEMSFTTNNVPDFIDDLKRLIHEYETDIGDTLTVSYKRDKYE